MAFTHGLTAYTNGRCRCPICREAKELAYRREIYALAKLARQRGLTVPEKD